MGDNFFSWKRQCLAQASTSERYKDLTLVDHRGDIILNPSMSKTTSTALWLATTKALGSMKDRFISGSNSSCNGYQLWSLMENTIVDTDTTISAELELDRKFKQLSRHPNEGVQSYTSRFDLKLAECKRKGFNVSTVSLKHFLSL